MKKKNIIICDVITPFIYGGAKIHVSNLINQIQQIGHNVEVISLPFFVKPNEELIRSSLIWRLIDIDKYTYSAFDLVITLKFPSYYIKANNKICWLMHQHRDLYDQFDSGHSTFDATNEQDMYLKNEIIKMDNQSLRECKKIFANSKNISKRLLKFNNIVSEPLYHPPKLAELLHFQSIGNYFFVLSRLEVNKRIDLIIKSLIHTDDNLKVVIAGTGPQEANLKALTESLGLNHRVLFLGFISDKEVIKHYAQCKGVIFTPQDEDYGYITIEAFLAQKIVITMKDSGGPLEFIDNNINGYIIDNNILDLANCLNKVSKMTNSELEHMGQKGLDNVKNINWRSVLDKLLSYA
jgi:glycosyltransferase involved in cell wall biosynthesis